MSVAVALDESSAAVGARHTGVVNVNESRERAGELLRAAGGRPSG